MSRFIKTLRQIVTYEYNRTRLYPNYPAVEFGKSPYATRNQLISVDTKAKQIVQFDAIYEKEGDIMPFGGAVHTYLRQYDSEWYNNEYVGRNT